MVLPHLDAGYALARWLTRNDADAADVVQEAYLRAFRYFDSYREGDAKSWLLKIVRRTCYDWLERNRPAELVPLEVDDDPDGSVSTDPARAALSMPMRCWRAAPICGVSTVLIERLPPPLREAIVLRELQELDYRQIAEVTGVPIGTVMSRLHRARAALAPGLGRKRMLVMECDEVTPAARRLSRRRARRDRAGGAARPSRRLSPNAGPRLRPSNGCATTSAIPLRSIARPRRCARRSASRSAGRRRRALRRPCARPGWLAYAASILLAVARRLGRNVADVGRAAAGHGRRRDHRQPSALVARPTT